MLTFKIKVSIVHGFIAPHTITSSAIKGLHFEHQNDDNFSFFGQTKLDQRQLPSKKLRNLLVGGANAVQRVKILFYGRISHAHQKHVIFYFVQFYFAGLKPFYRQSLAFA